MSDVHKVLNNIKTNNNLLIKNISTPFKSLYNAIHYHHSTRGKKMDFVNYRYLIDLYIDPSVEIYCKSSVQSGKSEWAVIDHLAKAEMGLTVLYVLPDEKLRTRFTRNRVDKLFSTVPYYSEMYAHGVGGSKNVNLKHYGKGTIVYASSGSPNDFKELPADAIYFDEYDQMNMTNIESATDRISSSDYKLIRCIANPTVSNFGIDEKINRTDNKFWFIKCEHCGEWQELDFFSNVVYIDDNGTYKLCDNEWDYNCNRDIKSYCKKCRGEIDRLSSTSNWVATYPNRNTSGYNISKIFSPHNTLLELWEKFSLSQNNESRLQVFYNSDLGQCYEASGSKLTSQILDACKADYIMPLTCEYPCCMGIDVGSYLHASIFRVFPDGDMMLMGVFMLKHFEEIDLLVTKFNVKALVVDALPETRKSLELCDRFHSISYMCYYTQNKFDEFEGLKKAVKMDSKRYVISADRLLIMDSVVEKFCMKKFFLPKNADQLFDGKFYAMLCVPTRIWVMEEGTDGHYVYTKGEDHWFHSINYALLARHHMRDFDVKYISNKPSDEALRGKILKEQNLIIPTTIPTHLRSYYDAIIAMERKQKN